MKKIRLLSSKSSILSSLKLECSCTILRRLTISLNKLSKKAIFGNKATSNLGKLANSTSQLTDLRPSIILFLLKVSSNMKKSINLVWRKSIK